MKKLGGPTPVVWMIWVRKQVFFSREFSPPENERNFLEAEGRWKECKSGAQKTLCQSGPHSLAGESVTEQLWDFAGSVGELSYKVTHRSQMQT